MLFVRRTLSVLAAASLVSGCAAQAASSHAANDRGSAGTVVTFQELAGIARQGTLLEALQQLRPEWLRSRGATAGVSVDGGAPGDLELLRMIPTSTVREVRFERASSSTGHALVSANGDVVVANMILVTTLHGR
jgi:hypothetical protein